MFKSLKEKKLGDKASQKPKASTPQKVPSESSTRDNAVDAKNTVQAVTPSDHNNEKKVPSTSSPEAVAVTTSNNSSQEGYDVHKKVR